VGTLLPIFAKEDPYYKGKEDEWENWENAYLPEDEEELRKMNIPKVPLLLYFPYYTPRRSPSKNSAGLDHRESGRDRGPGFSLPMGIGV
jgi:hypothetical protein